MRWCGPALRFFLHIPALLLLGLVLAITGPAGATVIAQAGFATQNSNCNGVTGTTVSDPSFAQNAGSDSVSNFSGTYLGEWDVVATPSLVITDVRATAYVNLNAWSCVPAVGTVNATDLTFSSVGGTETTVHVRFSLGFTSDWSGSNTLYRGVGAYAVLGSFVADNGNGGPFTVISRPPDDLGSDTACYTSPWIEVPVGVAQYVQYTMYGGTQASSASGFADAYSTMSAGCNGGGFIEILEPDFTFDSAELGIVAGAFVPEPASGALLLTSGLLGLGRRRRRC